MSGSRSIEYDVIVAFKKRNRGSPICIHRKATPHAVVAVKISAYNNFPVPGHLIQNCRIKVIVWGMVYIKMWTSLILTPIVSIPF